MILAASIDTRRSPIYNYSATEVLFMVKEVAVIQIVSSEKYAVFNTTPR